MWNGPIARYSALCPWDDAVGTGALASISLCSIIVSRVDHFRSFVPISPAKYKTVKPLCEMDIRDILKDTLMKEFSKKLRIAVLFGGRSAEHDVSVLSATNVLNVLSPHKYDPLPIFVTRNGQWLLSSFKNGILARPSNGTELTLMPGGHGRALACPEHGTPHELPKWHVSLLLAAAFPVQLMRWIKI